MGLTEEEIADRKRVDNGSKRSGFSQNSRRTWKEQKNLIQKQKSEKRLAGSKEEGDKKF